jgi:acyl-CoA synthetase (AMP-forming)/AMP-acid ligase II
MGESGRIVEGGRERPASRLAPPPIFSGGRSWSSDELASMATGWLDRVRAAVPRAAGLTAIVVNNHPETVALLFALSCLPLPVVILPADPRAWRSDPPLPPGTPVFVAPPLAPLAAAGRSAGLDAIAIPAARPAPVGDARFFSCPGFVSFTSGSTGLPKPVYITTRSYLTQTAAIVEASGLRPGDSVVGTLQLSTHYGLGQALILPTVLGSPLGLVERFDHRSLVALLAARRWTYWATTPLMADVLARAPIAGPPPPAPAICHVSAGKLAARTFHAFAARFGVTLRPSYGQTENGFIAVDRGEPTAIRPDRVGRPAPGIEVRIGEDPLDPVAAGELGRVWFRSPWYMEGYGFPPRLSPRSGRDGFWPTADVGFLDEDGYLALAGRADDCFKTGLGHLVNPGMIVDALMGHPRAGDVVVLPVGDPASPTIGALVESETTIDPAELRATAAASLPPWLQPQVLLVTPRLPRLAGGTADRDACRTLLLGARGSERSAGTALPAR